MQRLLLPALRGLGGALLGLLVAAAAAHSLRVSVQPEADGLRGQAFYADGTPARHEAVTLFGTDATAPLASTRTDADGRFRVLLKAPGTYRVVVEGDEGHRTEAAVVWSPSPATAGADAASLAALVRAEIAPLREDLARLEARTRVADLVGGVGILVGLAGAWAWWRARVKR